MIGNNVEKNDVRILITEELCENVVEIHRSDEMMKMCFIFGEKIIIDICLCTPNWKARYTEG